MIYKYLNYNTENSEVMILRCFYNLTYFNIFILFSCSTFNFIMILYLSVNIILCKRAYIKHFHYNN